MKKVLIVTPNWPPISCPDLHRARMALPYFAEFGWEPLILKINPEEQEGIKDPLLCRTLPDSIKTWQAGCLPLGLTKWTGLRNVGLRSFFHLAFTGDRIIRKEKPQTIFFSTTMFPLMTIGRYWKSRHGVPYVLDFQDPWVRNGASRHARSAKRKAVDLLAEQLEPLALGRVSRIVSVSAAYVTAFRQRYAWLTPDQFTVLPFGAPENDYEQLRRQPVHQTIFEPSDGKRHWVYVGRGGADMAVALKGLFQALGQVLESQPQLRTQLRLHFIGTDYAPKGRATKTVEPLAQQAGVDDLVTENTDRIPYFEALKCLQDADALIVPGSDDPGYTASKIYPYILARRPLLAIFHESSSVVGILHKTKAGTVVTFRSNEPSPSLAERILASGWLQDPPRPATNWSEFEPYTAREMTRRLCQVFDNSSG